MFFTKDGDKALLQAVVNLVNNYVEPTRRELYRESHE